MCTTSGAVPDTTIVNPFTKASPNEWLFGTPLGQPRAKVRYLVTLTEAPTRLRRYYGLGKAGALGVGEVQVGCWEPGAESRQRSCYVISHISVWYHVAPDVAVTICLTWHSREHGVLSPKVHSGSVLLMDIASLYPKSPTPALESLSHVRV